MLEQVAPKLGARKKKEERIAIKQEKVEGDRLLGILAYFNSFWNCVENGPKRTKRIDLDQIAMMAGEFWSSVDSHGTTPRPVDMPEPRLRV